MAASRTPADRAALVALGIAVRRLREDRGFSQEAFGHKIDVHRTYVGGIERGERNQPSRSCARSRTAWTSSRTSC